MGRRSIAILACLLLVLALLLVSGRYWVVSRVHDELQSFARDALDLEVEIEGGLAVDFWPEPRLLAHSLVATASDGSRFRVGEFGLVLDREILLAQREFAIAEVHFRDAELDLSYDIAELGAMNIEQRADDAREEVEEELAELGLSLSDLPQFQFREVSVRWRSASGSREHWSFETVEFVRLPRDCP